MTLWKKQLVLCMNWSERRYMAVGFPFVLQGRSLEGMFLRCRLILMNLCLQRGSSGRIFQTLSIFERSREFVEEQNVVPAVNEITVVGTRTITGEAGAADGRVRRRGQQMSGGF